MNRKSIRDLAANESVIKTAKFKYAKSLSDLEEAADYCGIPVL